MRGSFVFGQMPYLGIFSGKTAMPSACAAFRKFLSRVAASQSGCA
jgi:hypothetical protein